MKKGLIIGPVLAAAIFAGCNSDTDYEYAPVNYDGVAVTAFSLNKNSTVLNNLDSVYFTIDLNAARIFNADSLPYGTDVKALAVTMSTDQVSEAEFTVTRPEKEDTVINYLTSPNQKIDFSNGPVSLRLKSANGQHERVYEVKVNVHQVVTDSLYWSPFAAKGLPTSLQSPEYQKTVAFKGNALCLTTYRQDYSIASTSDPYAGDWQTISGSFPKSVDAATFSATDDALYILASDGDLLTSADEGATWTSTGETWKGVSASYGSMLVGVKETDGSLTAVSHPSGVSQTLPAGFPVAGTSAAVPFTSKWAISPQVMIAGGTDRNGSLTGATWAFDGTSWASIGSGLPAAEGYAMALASVCETDTVTWRVQTSQVLLAIGGRTATEVSRDVYISRDFGLNWQKAADLLQLPPYIPDLYSADLLVFDSTFTPSGVLPKAVKPIEQWEVAVLYLFGGRGDRGTLLPYYWRGAVNHLTFKPLQ